jgi:hypothetical protein
MRYILSLISAALLAAAGCGGSSPTPPEPQITQGFWTGTTASGDPVSFTVSGDSVTGLELVMVYTFPLTGYVDTVTWKPADAAISGNAFSMSDSVVGNPSFTLSLSGSFTPPGQVSGEVSSAGTYHPDSSTTDTVDVDVSWDAAPRD